MLRNDCFAEFLTSGKNDFHSSHPFGSRRCRADEKHDCNGKALNAFAELKQRGHIDLNLSRAENALKLIRHVLTFEPLSQDADLFLRYCMDVLKSTPDQMHIPEALLQASPDVSVSECKDRTDSALMHSGVTLEEVNSTNKLRTDKIPNHTGLTEADHFDNVRIEDLGIPVHDWLLSQFSHTAPQPHIPSQKIDLVLPATGSRCGQLARGSKPSSKATGWIKRIAKKVRNIVHDIVCPLGSRRSAVS